MKYKIAEKFKSIQGEGLYAGTPMAFIRFVGCSVGKKICQHCDTMFEEMLPWQGGGEFTEDELLSWAEGYAHICLTGGEPMDQDLDPFLNLCGSWRTVHIETSGTKARSFHGGRLVPKIWICVSPKPGFLEEEVLAADEVKVIVPGLGTVTPTLLDTKILSLRAISAVKLGSDEEWAQAAAKLRWPDLTDALRWEKAGKLVYVQPRNGKLDIDHHNLMIVQDLLKDYPQLRLSTQMHKILKVQ